MELYPKRSFEAYGGGAVRTGPPPAIDSLRYWLDFSDPTVLWAETNGTGAVADGGDIARVDNKGSVSTHWLEATIAERPHRNARGYADFTTLEHGLAINDAPALTGGARTVAFLGMSTDSDTLKAHYSGKLGVVFSIAMLFMSGDGAGAIGNATVYSSGAGVSPAIKPALGQTVSSITTSGASLADNITTHGYASWSPGSFDIPGIHDDMETTMQIGYNTAIATDGWGGKYGALMIWDRILNAGEIAYLKEYDTSKWGTVWA